MARPLYTISLKLLRRFRIGFAKPCIALPRGAFVSEVISSGRELEWDWKGGLEETSSTKRKRVLSFIDRIETSVYML